MEKVIKVNDKEVKFKASGATVRNYRQLFQRDLLMDVEQLNNEYKKKNLTAVSLEVFENLAYTMARQADDSIPDTADAWLDQFDMFSVYEILPQIVDLWNISTESKVEAKKKGAQPNVK